MAAKKTSAKKTTATKTKTTKRANKVSAKPKTPAGRAKKA